MEAEEAQDDDPIDPAAPKKKKKPKKKKGSNKSKDSEDAAEQLVAEEEAQQLAPISEDSPQVFDTAEAQEWADISKELDLATCGMRLGEMLESPHFRLFDSMSAIEIMDPKMDSGFNSSAEMTLPRAEEEGIISQSLRYEDYVKIWDNLLMYYLMWMDGHTLVQTCFSCLYLHDLEKYGKAMPPFGAFADAFLAACRLACAAVQKAGVYDDEDFMPSSFGMDLMAGVFSTEPQQILKRLEQERKGLAGSSPTVRDQVARRLEFVGEYMMALLHLSGDGSHADRADKRLGRCLEIVEKFREERPADATLEQLPCFDASLNRKLLVPGPPRVVEPILKRQIVLDTWTKHLSELRLVCSFPKQPLLAALECAVTHKGEPNILPRSLAQIRAVEAGHCRKLLLDSLDLYLFPQEALQHCEKSMEVFLEHSESLFAHTLKLAHANRARRFRRLAHVFPDFNTLQHEAWQLDEELKQTFGANLRYPRPCWVWIMEHCLHAMISKLFLGFDLELYDDAEIHMIYWYVDYLYGLRIYNLSELYHAKEQPLNSAKKKGGRQQDKGGFRPGSRARNPPPSLLLLEATQGAVRGLFRLLALSVRLGVMGVSAGAVEGLSQRFVLRFRALEQFRLPHLPSFKDFEHSSASAQAQGAAESRVVLDAAQASFAEASQVLERIAAVKGDGVDAKVVDEAKAVKRVVVANQLAVTMLQRQLDAGKQFGKVSVSLVHHPHLVSVQVRAAG